MSNGMKMGRAPGPSEVSFGLIAASGEVGIEVMAELCRTPGWIWNVS